MVLVGSSSAGWWKSLQDIAPQAFSDQLWNPEALAVPWRADESALMILKYLFLVGRVTLTFAWSHLHKRKSNFFNNPEQMNAVVEFPNDGGGRKETLCISPTSPNLSAPKSASGSLTACGYWFLLFLDFCLPSGFGATKPLWKKPHVITFSVWLKC